MDDLTKLRAVLLSPEMKQKLPLFNQAVVGKYGLLNCNLIHDYICYVYHPESPLRNYDSMNKIKVKAAEYAGFPRYKNGNFEEDYEDIILCKNEMVNKMIIQYLKIHGNPDYKRLCMYNDQLDILLNKLTELKDDTQDPKERKTVEETRKLIYSNIDSVSETIKNINLIFLKNDDNRDLLRSLYMDIEMENLGIFPEEIAEMLAQGVDPVADVKPNTRLDAVLEYIKKR